MSSLEPRQLSELWQNNSPFIRKSVWSKEPQKRLQLKSGVPPVISNEAPNSTRIIICTRSWISTGHPSGPGRPTHTAPNKDKAAPPPIVTGRTMINEATLVESASVLLHLHPYPCYCSECQQVTNDRRDVLCYGFPPNITLLITFNAPVIQTKKQATW